MASENNKLCFVLMPFKDDMKEIYWKAIKRACTTAGYSSLRVDEIPGMYNINQKIIEQIFSSDAIIADLTGWNPNVFYELGVAHAISNKSIMIIQRKEKLPFDVSNYRCVLYDKTEDGLKRLQEELVGLLMTLEGWRNQPTNPVQNFKPYEPAISKHSIDETDAAISTLQRQLERHRAESVPKAVMEVTQKAFDTQKKELQSLQQQLESLQKDLIQKQSEISSLTNKLELLSSDSVPKADLEAIQKMLDEREQALRQKDKELNQSVSKAELENLLNELNAKQTQNSDLQTEISQLLSQLSKVVRQEKTSLILEAGTTKEENTELHLNSGQTETRYSKPKTAVTHNKKERLSSLAFLITLLMVSVVTFNILIVSSVKTKRTIQAQKVARIDSLLQAANLSFAKGAFDETIKDSKQILSLESQHQESINLITKIEQYFQVLGDSAFVKKYYWVAIKNYEKAYDIKQNENIRKKLNQTQVAKDSVHLLHLRSKETTLLQSEVRSMLSKYSFYDSRWNTKAKGTERLYETVEHNGKKVIIDHATALTWQENESKESLSRKQIATHLNELNNENYGGYNDWRLPTLEEICSLTQPQNPHVDPVYGQTHKWVWTVDKTADSKVWVVDLSNATCSLGFSYDRFYVRAVRSN